MEICGNKDLADQWMEDEDNFVHTDAKLSQFKKNKNIAEAVRAYMENNSRKNVVGISFDIAKAEHLVFTLKEKIKKSANSYS